MSVVMRAAMAEAAKTVFGNACAIPIMTYKTDGEERTELHKGVFAVTPTRRRGKPTMRPAGRHGEPRALPKVLANVGEYRVESSQSEDFDHEGGFFADAIAFSPVRDVTPYRFQPGVRMAEYTGLTGNDAPDYSLNVYRSAAICVDVTGPPAPLVGGQDATEEATAPASPGTTEKS